MNRWIEIFFFLPLVSFIFDLNLKMKRKKFLIFLSKFRFFFEKIKFENVRSGHANLGNSE